MQYGRFASTRGIQMVTQVTIPAGMVIGEWGKGFTAEDIDTVFRMYGQPPVTTTVETNPPGLQVVVDRVAITGRQPSWWPPASVHTLSAADRQGDGSDPRYIFGVPESSNALRF